MVGRLVVTHSTYLEGLIPWLKALAKVDGIATITPGVISRSKGRSEEIKLKVTSEITGGYKMIARKGKTTQEVFLTTKMSREDLITQIHKTKPRNL